VDDIVNVWVLLEHLVERGLILDVKLVELWPLAADELNAVNNLLRGVVEIVDNDNFVAGLKKGKSCERANVTSTTGSCQQAALYGMMKCGVEG
jgi:hypothetical protein